MEFRLQLQGFMEFFAKQHLVQHKPLFCKKLHETHGLQFKFHELNIYIYLIYIYLLSLYNNSILDIEHSPYNIALGSTQTHKVI